MLLFGDSAMMRISAVELRISGDAEGKCIGLECV